MGIEHDKGMRGATRASNTDLSPRPFFDDVLEKQCAIFTFPALQKTTSIPFLMVSGSMLGACLKNFRHIFQSNFQTCEFKDYT